MNKSRYAIEDVMQLEAENAELKKQVADPEQEVQDTFFTCIISHHEEEIKHEVEHLRQQVEDEKGRANYNYDNLCKAEKEIQALLRQVEDMKFRKDCNNCRWRNAPHKGAGRCEPCKDRSNWQSDNMTREARNDG